MPGIITIDPSPTVMGGGGGSARLWKAWNQIIHATLATTTCGTSITAPGYDETTTTSVTAAKTWMLWNKEYMLSTTGPTVWNSGVTSASGGTAADICDPWPVWNAAFNALGGGAGNLSSFVRTDVAREERRLADRERSIRLEGERQLAREKAQRLLGESLSEVQRHELAANGYFTLETFSESNERRLYRIKRGRVRNVQQVDDNGRVLKTLCAHPIIACPDEDTMLSQKLWLETREQEFLSLANHS